MSEYDDIDGLTGGKAIDFTITQGLKEQEEREIAEGKNMLPGKPRPRIKPADKQQFQGGNSASKISADPQNTNVAFIISMLEEGKIRLARDTANKTQAPEFLNDFITEYVKNGGQDCLLYTSPSPRDGLLSRMPSSA